MPLGTETESAARSSPAAERIILAPEERRGVVVEALRGAKRRIALSMFRCTDFKVMDELGEALARGVKVDLLLTQRAKGWERKIRDLGLYLESMGAHVHRYSFSRVKYHAKYVVVDDGPALVASLNFTRKCFERTCDFLLATHDADVISGLVRIFEQDITSPDFPLPRDLTDRLIIGPDWARAQFLELIESARRSVRIIDHRVTDPEVLEVLRGREAAGVSVKIFGKGAVEGRQSHGKMMLIDDSKAVIGSISLSRPSLDARREVAIVVEQPACVAQLAAFMQAVETGAAAAPQSADRARDEVDDEDDEEDNDS